MSNIKYVDLDGLSHFKSKIDSTYVAQEAGKGLSSNDYTNAEKTKLAGIDTGAEVNVIESVVVNGETATISGKTASVTIETGAIDTIKVNGTAQTITNKAVDITVPTKTSDLTNDDNVVKDASYVHTDNNYTTTEKNKLSGIEAQANKTVVDDALSSSSTNPVQNKAINTALGNKVDKVSGKGLSTNDYTTEEKTKLSGIATGAEVNVIETVKVNGTAQTITSKAVDISVPTNNNQLTNGAGYQTSSQVESAITAKGYQTASQVSTAISTAIAGVTQFDYSIVTSLPASGVKGTIYLVSNSGTGTNLYDEYLWINNKWEKLGTTTVDLSGYVKFTDLVAITNTEINALFE